MLAAEGLTLLGTSFADEFGYAVANAGDVDGDGRSDVMVGVPGLYIAQRAISNGRGAVYSSAGGTPLVTGTGAATYGALGRSLAAGADIDGDGDAVFPLAMPADPLLSGQSFYFEWAVIDAGGPTGIVALSDALAVTIS